MLQAVLPRASCQIFFTARIESVKYQILHSSPLIFLSCCTHVLSCSCHVCINVLSCSVAMLCIKHTGLRKVICSMRSGRYPPKCSRCSRVFLMLFSFLRSFCYRFGGLCRLPSSGFMNMYMYKLVIVLLYSHRFLGR